MSLPSPARYQILYVEDNDADAMVMAMALKECADHHDLTILKDGRKALEFISAKPFLPDVVILDAGLPFRNGVQVLEALRADPLMQNTAVVFFVSPGYPDAPRAGELNATLCTPKPFDLAGYIDLAKNIMHLCGPSRLSQCTR